MRALQVCMVDMIATEYEAKCSALNVVVNKALGQYFSLLASEKTSAQSCHAE
ncbi:hypothetical protein Q2Q11_001066 [Escherichia coli]|uniref:hypothetical protein n=1 Tax=Escherichia coli TaxID=562 RepID=UPI0012FF65AA|nr:hypothetical protein [Escherichia coli]EIQ2250083.1 hypothetical protein [Escherichia coli]ELN3539974.1 hypothetical protein [Escherichia coli]ELN3544984.1 hypothetical protein [Escherichia coli]ELN3559306.1 hypothetical protein [Escherichia coli]ELN3569201.1 hypothetical protein [Escherichia coli]